MHIENVMLEYLQSENFGITIHDKGFDTEDLTQWEEKGFNILVLSEGNVGLKCLNISNFKNTISSCHDKLKSSFKLLFHNRGKGGRSEDKIFSPSPFGPKNTLEDTPTENILGIYFEDNEDVQSMIPLDEGMAITISQSRYLLNPFGKKKGFLNMWMTEDENNEIKGTSGEECIQNKPCVFYRNENGSQHTCPTHGTTFYPSIPGMETEVWSALQDGLKLYGIPEQKIKLLTKFTINQLFERIHFYADLSEYWSSQGQGHEPSQKRPFAFIIGDGAIRTSFRAGRGLNTGLKSAISLSTSISSRDLYRLRKADFVEHNSKMSALQEREVAIRSREMMKGRKMQGWKPVGRQIIDAKNIFVAAKSIWNSSDNLEERKEMKREFLNRCRRMHKNINRRIPQNISSLSENNPETSTLETFKHLEANLDFDDRKPQQLSLKSAYVICKSFPWPNYEVGGDEVNVGTPDSDTGNMFY